MNYGTPIVSIVDYNLDVRQENPSYLQTASIIVNNNSSPVPVNIMNFGSQSVINTIGVVGYVSNLPIVKAQILNGAVQLIGGYLGNISSLPPVLISSNIIVGSIVSTVPYPVTDKLIINNATLTASGSSPTFWIGGGKQIDIGIVISSATGTSLSFYFSLVTIDSSLNVPYANYNTTTFTTAGIYWLTIPQGNFLGDEGFIGYSISGTSTALTGTYVRVVVK